MPKLAAIMPAIGSTTQKLRPSFGAEQRVAIGADGVEGDVAEVEQARQADHDVEAPAEHDVGQDQHGEIHRLLVGERQ